jgi:hypothetical protein
MGALAPGDVAVDCLSRDTTDLLVIVHDAVCRAALRSPAG